MIPLLMAQLAHSQELPPPAEAPAIPYPVTLVGVGRGLNLEDPQGHRVRLEDALVALGQSDRLADLQNERVIRNATSISCWAVGGALILGQSLLPLYMDQPISSDTQLAMSLTGGALVGGGFVARFAGRRNDLGDWVDPTLVEAAVQAHNAHFVAPPPLVQVPGEAPSVRVPPPVAYALRMDGEGRIRDGRGRIVNVPELAKALRDEELASEYASGRRMDKAIWITTLAVGGGVVVVSLGAFLYGFGVFAFEDIDRGGTVMLTSLGAGALGGLAVGGGAVGLGVSKRMRSDPRNWYDVETLQQKMDAYNAGISMPALPATQPILLEVHPLIGPGVVGVTGTF